MLLAWAAPLLHPGLVLGAIGLLFAPWLWLLLQRKHLRPRDLIAVAILARVALAFADPLLSDDIYRYVWDGRVWASGVNPFAHAPAAEALAHLRDAGIWPRINHAHVPTIYPPVAQLTFAANALLGGGVAGMKLLFVGVELTALAALIAWLGHRHARWDLVRDVAIIYALNPLILVEVAWSGHVDVLAWSTLAAALLVWSRTQSARGALAAGALLGASVAAKFLSLLALPLMLLIAARPSRHAPAAAAIPWRRRLVLCAAVGGVVFASYLPFLDAGERLFAGFGTYAAQWRGNDGPFRAAYRVAEHELRDVDPAAHPHAEAHDEQLLYRYDQYDRLFLSMGWTRDWQGQIIPATSFGVDQLAQQIAKGWAALLVALALLWAWLVVRDPTRGTLVVLGVLFFVAPVVHPWYVAWLVGLAALIRAHSPDSPLDVCGVGSPAALAFACVVPLAYLGWAQAQTGGDWRVPDWAVLVEFGTVAAFAAWELTTGPPSAPHGATSARSAPAPPA